LDTPNSLLYFIFTVIFYIHGFMHRNYILIRPNKMQQYAGIYLLQSHSTCFRCPSHPSSGAHKTATAASGTGHSIWATTFFRCGLIRPCRRKVVYHLTYFYIIHVHVYGWDLNLKNIKKSISRNHEIWNYNTSTRVHSKIY
jgi:hypothetical protein